VYIIMACCALTKPAIPAKEDKTKKRAAPGIQEVRKHTRDTALVQIKE
jgi:hypothetical protein